MHETTDYPIATWIPLLGRTDFFAGLDESVLGRVAEAVAVLDAADRDVIIRSGSDATSMFVLARGHVDVLAEEPLTGNERLLTTLTPGACFGEVALCSGAARTATVRARGECLLLELSAEAFWTLMEHIPAFAAAVCRGLARTIDRMTAGLGYRFVRLTHYPFDAHVLQQFTRKRFEYFGALPLREEGGRVTVAVTDPTDLLRLDELRRELGQRPIDLVVASRQDLEAFFCAHVERSAWSGGMD